MRLRPIHPIHFHSLLGEFHQIKEYQVVYENGDLHVYLVIHDTEDMEAFARHVENRLRRQLESLEAKCPAITYTLWNTSNGTQNRWGN